MEAYPHQKPLAEQVAKTVKSYGLCYLTAEIRVGKTFISFLAAQLLGAKEVLFVTKKRAINFIRADFEAIKPDFNLYLVNYERLHKLGAKDFDLIILDEAHCLGQYPIPAIRTKILKALCVNKRIVYLSGTPTPESFTQLYHQFYVSSFSPWINYKKFYDWANDYVYKQSKKIGGHDINDYSNDASVSTFGLYASLRGRKKTADEKVKIQEQINEIEAACNEKKNKILADFNLLKVTFTQVEAGFEMLVQEEIIYVPMSDKMRWAVGKMKKDKMFITRDGGEVIGDTAAKHMNKMHQLCSGTVKFEDGNSITFDDTKAQYIKQHFAGRKIAIFYKYVAEGMLLAEVFTGQVETDAMAFNKGDKTRVFLCQVVAGREGINLATADCLVMYNIDFAALTYWQARGRLQTKDRTEPAKVYWVFTEGGIERSIYDTVQGKRDYTTIHYKREFLSEAKAPTREAGLSK